MLGFLFRIVTVFVSALVTKLDLSGLPISPQTLLYFAHNFADTRFFQKFCYSTSCNKPVPTICHT